MSYSGRFPCVFRDRDSQTEVRLEVGTLAAVIDQPESCVGLSPGMCGEAVIRCWG